jgi:CheY-like chemotaxis protein
LAEGGVSTSEVRVLVVEDEPAVRHLIDRILTRRGHSVVTAPSAHDADAILLDFPAPIAVALLDLVLPGIGGREYADRLARRFPAIRVIFMTGWFDNPELRAAEASGPLLLKPFSTDALIAATESVGRE